MKKYTQADFDAKEKAERVKIGEVAKVKERLELV